jgi:hypothetical protein
MSFNPSYKDARTYAEEVMFDPYLLTVLLLRSMFLGGLMSLTSQNHIFSSFIIIGGIP